MEDFFDKSSSISSFEDEEDDDCLDYLSEEIEDSEVLSEETLRFNNFDEILEEDSVEYDLEPVKHFIDEFVGLVITEFKDFKGTSDFSTQEVGGSILTCVNVNGNALDVHLASLSGKSRGKMKLYTSLSGQFSDKSDDPQPSRNSIYRIKFMGGHTIEYMDSDFAGFATFFDNQRELN